MFCEMAYVEYDFFGENFVTDCVQQETFSPQFDYTHIHHVPKVTPEFVQFLKSGSVEMEIHVTQHVKVSDDKIGTDNSIVVESIKTGEAKGYENGGATKPVSDAEVRSQQLAIKVAALEEEKKALEERI